MRLMLKAVLLSVFFWGLVPAYGYSQTYKYKCDSNIDEHGIKSQCPINLPDTYWTFANDKSLLFESDGKGFRKQNIQAMPGFPAPPAATYRFEKTHQGTHVYVSRPSGMGSEAFTSFMYFNSDYSKYQRKLQMHKHRTEYIRVDELASPSEDIPIF